MSDQETKSETVNENNEAADEANNEKIIGRIGSDKFEILQHFAEGRKFYKLMMFDKAKDCFFNALKIDKDDGPSKVYFARCKHYMESPPPEDWDGVFIMRTK